MNQEIKKKWVEALRSGDYKQTTGYLKRDNCFCALGVLCDLYIKEQSLCEWTDSYCGKGYLAIQKKNDPYSRSIAALISCIVDWAGCSADPKVNGEYISRLNDTGIPFSKIADLIEAEL